MFNISNAAITCLLKFLKFFLKSLGSTFSLNSLITFSEMLPLSLATCYKHCFGASDDSNFVCYVACPVCKSVYDYDDYVHKWANGLEESKNCRNQTTHTDHKDNFVQQFSKRLKLRKSILYGRTWFDHIWSKMLVKHLSSLYIRE